LRYDIYQEKISLGVSSTAMDFTGDCKTIKAMIWNLDSAMRASYRKPAREIHVRNP